MSADFTGPDPTPAPDDLSLRTTVAPDPTGSPAIVIGRYKLLHRIAEGGMGEVWLAEQTEPVRRRVALKLLKAGLIGREAILRFESERQALALMDHPAIAKVLDGGSTPSGAPFLVMEYVAGTPITEYCDRHTLGVRERLDLFIQVCEGVQHAHQKAIIHRDLKPSNILVTEVNERAVPKIIDFGLAKALTQKLTAATLYTRVGTLVGTPEYMSPEQALSSGEDIDTRTDVYSLGIVFYELLAGAPPIELRHLALDEFLRRLRDLEPPKPSVRIRAHNEASASEVSRKRRTEPRALIKQLHGDLDAMALKALEKDRSRRYASPSDLAADIRRHLNSEPVVAVPPSPLYRAGKFARRYRAALMTATAFVLVLITAAAVSVWQSVRATNQRYRADQQAAVAQAVDARSDLWSFGVVLYELATAVRPFDGATSAIVFEELLNKTPVPVRTRNPKVPHDLERVIVRLLEKDRETRYQSAADVRADLKRIARDSHNTDAAISTPSVTAAPVRNRRIPMAAGGLALVLLATVVWLATRQDGGPVTSPDEYVPLTNFADSVTDPSLSPDGRMVTFIRGDAAAFPRIGDIYVKLLPDGEAVRLTNTQGRKYGPVFTPDGSRVAYTQRGATWDTWTVPIAGGEPTRMLPNASGLYWIDSQHVLFSEIKGTGLHMGIVTSTTSRSDKREIYYPEHERAMAHYALRSPDQRSLIIVEMDRVQAFLPCRLVPFDGSSPGRQVGPSGSCTAAAWSPDGNWMYFAVEQSGRSRLWRQRYPDGQPEQITFGPTEETGLAVAADGRSIVTAVGQERGAIWMHDERGDRQITTEGVAYSPRLSVDGKRLYYLVRPNAYDSVTELRVLDLSSGKTDRLLPDRSITQFAISPDERDAAFTTTTPAGLREIWVAPLDRSTPPVRIVENGDEVSFGPGSELIFRALDNTVNYLTSIHRDGTGRRQLLDTPILNKFGVSPDGKWATVLAPGTGEGRTFVTLGVPLDGGAPHPVCFGCSVNWTDDGKWLYVGPEGAVSPTTVLIPTSGGAPPGTLAAILQSVAKGDLPPGTRLIEKSLVVPGRDPSTYVFTRRDVQRNLFRIPLH